jgi:hypothetical protein
MWSLLISICFKHAVHSENACHVFKSVKVLGNVVSETFHVTSELQLVPWRNLDRFTIVSIHYTYFVTIGSQ